MAAVPVRLLLAKLRLRLGDMQKTKFSDYELLSALSDAWVMLWIALAENFSTIPRKSVQVALTNGSGPLPDDFYSLIGLEDGIVRDGRVEGSGEKAMLEYNCVPSPITESAAEIDFPTSLVLDLVEVASAVASGNTTAGTETARATATRVSQKREYGKIPDIRHFP